MIQLSDEDILRRLTDTEDSTVERKTASDFRDCLKTAVAFSNALPVGDPGIIFIGVGNDGTVQDNANLDSLQKKVSEELSKVYPPIYPQMKVMPDALGKEFLAMIVRGSENRPHFAGPSYIRDGSKTVEASKKQFDRLIAERNSKTREILKWRGKEISVYWPPERLAKSIYATHRTGALTWTVIDCNQFYATLERYTPSHFAREAFPLSDLEIGYDNDENRLQLRLKNSP